MRYLKKVLLVICIELYHLIDQPREILNKPRYDIFQCQYITNDFRYRVCLLFQSRPYLVLIDSFD
jgi:hypothetical protein